MPSNQKPWPQAIKERLAAIGWSQTTLGKNMKPKITRQRANRICNTPIEKLSIKTIRAVCEVTGLEYVINS